MRLFVQGSLGELWTCVQQTHVDLNRNKEPAAEIARSVILELYVFPKTDTD